MKASLTHTSEIITDWRSEVLRERERSDRSEWHSLTSCEVKIPCSLDEKCRKMLSVPECPSIEHAKDGFLHLFTLWTCCQKVLVLEEARASANLLLRMWCSRRLRRRTSYLYLALANFFKWWRTPAEGEQACFQTLCQRFAFVLNFYADDFQPGLQPKGRFIGKVLSAESCRQLKRSAQNLSMQEWWLLQQGLQQEIIESDNKGIQIETLSQ